MKLLENNRYPCDTVIVSLTLVIICSLVARHCLQHRNAELLSLNPATAALPGLSPQTVAIVPKNST